MSRTAAARLLALLAVVAVPAACGDEGVSGSAAEDAQSGATEGSGTEAGDTRRPDTEDGDAIHIEVTARSFEFEPGEITVPAGEEIGIVLTSTDGLHDLVIDEFDLRFVAAAGETTYGSFRADEPGRYTIYCSIEGHRDAGMEAVLVVEALTG